MKKIFYRTWGHQLLMGSAQRHVGPRLDKGGSRDIRLNHLGPEISPAFYSFTHAESGSVHYFKEMGKNQKFHRYITGRREGLCGEYLIFRLSL